MTHLRLFTLLLALCFATGTAAFALSGSTKTISPSRAPFEVIKTRESGSTNRTAYSYTAVPGYCIQATFPQFYDLVISHKRTKRFITGPVCKNGECRYQYHGKDIVGQDIFIENWGEGKPKIQYVIDQSPEPPRLLATKKETIERNKLIRAFVSEEVAKATCRNMYERLLYMDQISKAVDNSIPFEQFDDDKFPQIPMAVQDRLNYELILNAEITLKTKDILSLASTSSREVRGHDGRESTVGAQLVEHGGGMVATLHPLKQLSLRDILRTGYVPHLHYLRDCCFKAIYKDNGENQSMLPWIRAHVTEEERAFKSFHLNRSSGSSKEGYMTFSFDGYPIATNYILGIQEASIPYSQLKIILAPHSPIIKLMK